MANYNGFGSLPSKLNVGDTIRVNYTGSVITWKPYDNKVARMRVKCYGASGADTFASKGGNGGYASGEISVTTETLYFSVGAQGGINSASRVWGGGGAYGGGGATWIAKNNNPTSKDNLYIVAGGGGAGSKAGSDGGAQENGGHGGGLSGLAGAHNYLGGGKQDGIDTSRYTSNADGAGFLLGGNALRVTEETGGGGGSGLYGGRGSAVYASHSWTYAGGGGSSYIGGVQNGVTYDGSTTHGNKGNGYIIITILEQKIEWNIQFVDKKDTYDKAEPIKFSFTGDTPDKLQVKVGRVLIQEFVEPTVDLELEFKPLDEMFLCIPNGIVFVSFIFIKDGFDAYEKVETFAKYSDKITITTNIIDINSSDIILDLNLNISKYSEIKIEVCNNGYDEHPTWEDNTNRILKGLNVRLNNKIKTNDRWGLRIKITASQEFDMSELIIGGYYENIQESHME